MGFFSRAGTFLRRNSTTILTTLAVGGTITSVVLAVDATRKASPIVDSLKAQSAPGKEIFKRVAPLYVPTVIMTAVSVGCAIGSHVASGQQVATLTSLYSAGEIAAAGYRQKVLEKIGEKEELAIRDAVAQQRIADHPVTQSKVVITGYGDELFYDSWTGRYFRSSLNKIRSVENDVNAHLVTGVDMWMTLNEVYDAMNLPPVDSGRKCGFSVDNRLSWRITTGVSDDERVCFILTFDEDHMPEKMF